MKLGAIKCFYGEEGVYYEAYNDVLWLFTNKQFRIVATGILMAKTCYFYDIECSLLKKPNTMVAPSNTLFYIGEFD